MVPLVDAAVRRVPAVLAPVKIGRSRRNGCRRGARLGRHHALRGVRASDQLDRSLGAHLRTVVERVAVLADCDADRVAGRAEATEGLRGVSEVNGWRYRAN